MLKRLLMVIVLGLLAVLTPLPALANPPVTCPPGSTPDPSTGACVIVVGDPGGPGGPRNPGKPGTPGGAGNRVPPKCIMATGKEVPCRDNDSWWVNSRACYVKQAAPQPAKSDPIWQGHTDGVIYSCYDPLVGKWGGTPMTYFWSATVPGGPAEPPDQRVLAQQAIAVMNLKAISIGIVPEPRPGSVGIIGMPTWMWAQNPDQATWGPVTRSASAGGFTVTATAKAQRVVWTMGDGSTVTCAGPGTPYADSYGKKSSPDCGHTYTRQGAYTVRATSYWLVTWSGVGQSGTIPLSFSRTSNITMGEAQVLTQ